MNINAALSMN